MFPGEVREHNGQVLLLNWFWLGAPSMGEDRSSPITALGKVTHVTFGSFSPLLPQGKNHVR